MMEVYSHFDAKAQLFLRLVQYVTILKPINDCTNTTDEVL